MCGECEATQQIPNPNGGEDGTEDIWDVCKECADFVVRGQSLVAEVIVAKALGENVEQVLEKHGFKKK